MINGDAEKNVSNPEVDYPDPYDLRQGIKSPSQLSLLRQQGKRLHQYHRSQNELIGNLLKPMAEHTSEAEEDEKAARLPLYAAISAASLSILSTGVDSIFDLGSNLLLFYIHRKSARMDVNKWPVGGARLEPIGNIVYGSLMSSVNLIVVVEGVQTLINHTNGEVNEFHLPSLIAVSAALGVKGLLFLYCLSLRGKSSQVHVLWEDHRNDLFINSFAILTSAGGSKLRWWLDPMGGIIIASGVITAWSITIARQFALLAGKSAPHEFLQLLTYKTMTFHEKIKRVDTVRAYHSGPDYFVEIDVIMPAEIRLGEAHDIAQQLQDEIEVLPNVERAFVHIDYEGTHTPEHRKKKM